MGSTGPRSTRPDGTVWGTDFPPITLRDMVRAQQMLMARLNVEKLFAVIGGSMGGMQVLQWAATFPSASSPPSPIASAALHSAQNIAFNEVSRQAIFADPDWNNGQLLGPRPHPRPRPRRRAHDGAHHLPLRRSPHTEKFGRRTRGPTTAAQEEPETSGLFGEVFEVESYLRHQGSSFVRRFDANSYLTVTRAMDWFDLAAEHDGNLSAAFRGTRTRFCLISFTSDWLFPTAQSRNVARALNRAAANVSFRRNRNDRGTRRLPAR